MNKLLPMQKMKYTIQKSEDPKIDILFQDSGLSNYFFTFERDENLPLLTEDEEDILWKMKSYGSPSIVGSGDGIFLTSPLGKLFPFSYRLQFENTKNTTEYEALLLGMDVFESMGIKKLKYLRNSQVIVKQVRDQYQVKNPKLKYYRDRVWDYMESFDAFSIQVIPHEKNEKSISLAISTSLMTLHPSFNKDKVIVEMMLRLNLMDSWCQCSIRKLSQSNMCP